MHTDEKLAPSLKYKESGSEHLHKVTLAGGVTVDFGKEVWMEEASSSRVLPQPFTARERMLLQGFKDYLIKMEVLSTPQDELDELSTTNKRYVAAPIALSTSVLL